jgi:predicted regulator of Ras-like GTPase activity (Roadblock/LC7/MglB family)
MEQILTESTLNKLSPEGRELATKEALAILNDISGVAAVVIATVDGFDVASEVRNGLDPARIAALASSIAAIGEVVATEARLGRNKSVTIDTEAGFAVIYSVHRRDIGLVINVIATSEALIGQVNYRTAAAARALVTT